MRYVSTKTYGHELGFSAAFRQWRAKSHCRFLHGYALQFRLEFEAVDLDARNWVVDFGGLKQLKTVLEDLFDHKTVVAKDDPELEWFKEAHKRGIIDMLVVDATGCERFAQLVHERATRWLAASGYAPRVRVRSVEVSEHGANSAIVIDGDDARVKEIGLPQVDPEKLKDQVETYMRNFQRRVNMGVSQR